jgi:hypothetical protein
MILCVVSLIASSRKTRDGIRVGMLVSVTSSYAMYSNEYKKGKKKGSISTTNSIGVSQAWNLNVSETERLQE